jgi:predicted AAA+ superfamily ATPase
MTLIRKIIFVDILILFRIDYPEILYKIIKIIGAQTGMLVEYQNLSNDLNISSKTLAEYFWYLEEAFWIRILYNF